MTPNQNYSVSSSSPIKHSKISNSSNYTQQNQQNLLPGLPNDLALLILSKSIPPSLLFSVCRSWRRLIYSRYFPPFFSLYAVFTPIPNRQTNFTIVDNTTNAFYSFDPLSSTWIPLPLPPPDPSPLFLRRHPSFLSRTLPIQSTTVSNRLVIVSGTTLVFGPALSSPLVFDTETSEWSYGPPFVTPRRWCATGSSGGSVYVASGVGWGYHCDVARSMEQWDLNDDMMCSLQNNKRTSEVRNWRWRKKSDLENCRFSREAVDFISYRGRLCMVNVKGNATKDGASYDIVTDTWHDMPLGMLAGWNGPAGGDEDEDEMYAVDERRGSLSKYEGERDIWEMVVELPELKNAEQITVGKGKVCVVCANGEKILVVDVRRRPVRVWEVEPPVGLQAVAVHILPRMSREEC